MSSPRRLAVVGPFPPYRGGISQFNDQLARHLEKAGHVVERVSFSRQYPAFLFPGTSQVAPESAPTTSRAAAAAAAVTGIAGSTEAADARGHAAPPAAAVIDSIAPWTWRRAAGHIADSGATDVILAYWMPFFAPALTAIANRLRKAGIRVTALVHNARPHERQPFGAHLTRRFLKACDQIIVLSPTVSRDVRALAAESEIHVLHHPIYEQFGEAIDQTQARGHLGLSANDRVLLFFGLIRHYKGLDVLINALACTRDTTLKLVVAGEFYDDEEVIRKLVTDKNLSDRVQFTNGYVPDSEVGIYFSAADVVVQPYRSATQSGVVQTAFQFGRPVIVTGVGGLPDMVREGEDAFVVPPGDEMAIASAIDAFFAPETRERLTRGATMARSRSTWASFVEAFDGALQVAGSPSPT